MFLCRSPNAWVFANYRLDCAAYGNTVAGYEQDILDAQAIGVDGFELDMFGWTDNAGCAPARQFETWTANMFTAAANLGTRFKLFFMLDEQTAVNAGTGTQAVAAADAAAMMVAYANHANYFHVNGKPLLSAWSVSLDNTPGSGDDIFWSAVLSAVAGAGVTPFFAPNWTNVFPVYGNPSVTYSNLQSWSTSGWLPAKLDGLIAWDSCIASLGVLNNDAYRQLGVDHGLFIGANVNAWQSAIRGYSQSVGSTVTYLEGYGYEQLATEWDNIISNTRPNMVMLNTWNDYSESYMGPVSQATMTTNDNGEWGATADYLYSHAGFTALNKYYIQWSKTGVQPTWPDAMYVSYRTAPMATVPSLASATPVPSWNPQTHAPTLDDIYVTTILTAPATVRITTNGVDHDTSVAAGVVHTRQAFTAGAQRFRVIRSGTTLIDITGANVNSSETYYYNSNPVTYYGYAA